MKTRNEMITSDNVRLIIMKDDESGNFWWFNFQRKEKLFGHSDGKGNATKYYEEVKKYLEEQK